MIEASKEVLDVLAHFGVRPNHREENPTETAEEFLAHFGIIVPEDPSDDFYDVSEDFIAQFGIMGMKWGRRRARGSDGRVDKSDAGEIDKSKVAGARSETKGKSDSKADGKLTRPNIKSMTNEELQATIKRLQLEQQLVQLTAPKKSTAAKFIQDVLLTAGKQQATAYASQFMNKGIEAGLKKAGVTTSAAMAAAARDQVANEQKKKES